MATDDQHPVPIYEFRVTGEIGPVIRSAVPELTAAATENSCVLSGSVDGALGLARLLDRLADLHLVESEIRIHRAARGALS